MKPFKEVQPETVMGAWNLIKDLPYDSLIDAAVHGFHGSILVDDLDNPTICQINVSGTYYFVGNADHSLAKDLVKYNIGKWAEIIVNDEWAELVKQVHKGYYRETKRYSFTHEKINADDLNPFIDSLPKKYTIKKIDRNIAEQLNETVWGKYLVCNFKSIDEYLEKGAGFCVLDGETIVSGASSYIRFNGGFEVEIDTHRDYRNQGLATAIGAKFVQYCLEHDHIPHWDAENKHSIRLAEKLGFIIDREYDVIEINYYK